MLTIKKAIELLEEGRVLNPGEWVDHSINVGKVARKLAEALNEDVDRAECYGYIHDIGRRVGRCNMKHVIEGYKYLKNLGYEEEARYCLTHSFYSNTISYGIGNWDISEEDKDFIKNYIENTKFNIYDKIVQLADCIAMSNGVTLIERRLIDVSLRYGFDENTEIHYKERLGLQEEIEDMLGHSIYELFKEELIENLTNNKIKDVIALKK